MAWKIEGTYFENCNCDWVCLEPFSLNQHNFNLVAAISDMRRIG